MRTFSLCLVLGLLACNACTAPGTAPLIAARPYLSAAPAVDRKQPLPLLILLHGYGASGQLQDAYWGLNQLVNDVGILYAYPDGTRDTAGNRFWNATDACCNFNGSNVDDVDYIEAIIDDMSRRYRVDRKRIYVVGHSNGGFMSYRLACDLAPRIAAIASLAGHNWLDPARCQPREPVAVLQIHGTADATVPYNGGTPQNGIGGTPSAPNDVAGWATRNGCTTLAQATTTLDVDNVLAGTETTVDRWQGCRGGAAELWTIAGGSHVPALVANWPTLLWSFLSAHSKP